MDSFAQGTYIGQAHSYICTIKINILKQEFDKIQVKKFFCYDLVSQKSRFPYDIFLNVPTLFLKRGLKCNKHE